MAILQIQLLGEFRLADGDILITTVNTPRLQALLAYLLLHREAPQSRRHLAFLFWPDSSETQARTNLRHQFHLLRQAFPLLDTFLCSETQTVQWRPDSAYQLDVVDFEQATASTATLPALQAAVDLYQGDLLPGCYDDWILPVRERLRQRFVAAMERLVTLLEQTRDYPTAIRYAQRLRQFDPLHEATYRQLMRLYALLGDSAGVQRVYQSCVAVMQRELNALPTPATEEAYVRFVQSDTAVHQRHNLPPALTPFVGRSDELTTLTTLLADPSCRLLMITGAGGIGKTRLALEAAQGQLGRYLHGVFVVELAAITAPEFMIPAIADALQFTFYGPQEPKVQLLNYLREKELLLLLDNIEHLLAGVDLLTAILRTAPAVKLVVTSRERLKLPSEWVYEIQGLAVPDQLAVARMEEYGAVQLFVQSARRVQPDFPLDAAAQQAIIRLCQLVEGLPLGLELAAGWVRLLSCTEIVQELSQSLDLLATTAHATLSRHRSIRAVFDHSWQLLTEQERQVFCHLAVFQGGFQREAAIQVAGASLPVLALLVDKSLLRRQPSGRYALHELVRQYAAEKLTELAGDQETTRTRHSHYYLAYLRDQEPRLKSRQTQAALSAIRVEMDNCRLAWQWAVSHGWADVLGATTQTLWLFYDHQGWYHEAVATYQQAAAALEALTTAEDQPLWASTRNHRIGVGQLLAQQGWFLLHLGQLLQARTLFQQSEALLRRAAAPTALADTLQIAAMGAWMSGEYLTAQTLAQEALTIFYTEESAWDICVCFLCLGNIATMLGNYSEAKTRLEQALTLAKEIGEPKLTVLTLSYLGYLADLLGNFAEVRQWAQESVTLSHTIGDRWSMIMALNRLGAVMALGDTADWPTARQLHAQSLLIAKELGNHRETAISHNYLGYVAYALADYPNARHHFLTALQIATSDQITPVALDALVGLATVTAPTATAQALAWLALVLHHTATSDATHRKAQQLWSDLAVAHPLLTAAQAERQVQPLEAVVAELLGQTPR